LSLQDQRDLNIIVKGLVSPKNEIVSSFTTPHVIPNLQYSSSEHKNKDILMIISVPPLTFTQLPLILQKVVKVI